MHNSRRFWAIFQVDRSRPAAARFGLHTRVGLVLTSLAAALLMVAAGLWLHATRLAIHEEIEAASRVSQQWLRVAIGSPGEFPVAEDEVRLLAIARQIGRVRANELQVRDADGQLRYRSPAPTYKAGRAAPAWFSALLASDYGVYRQQVGRLTVLLLPDASRAELDAWDELQAMAGWAVLGLLALFLACRQALAHALRPLEQVMHALDRTGRGRFDIRLPEFASPELGRLARAFNGMADCLKAAVDDNVRHETEREVASCLQAKLAAERREVVGEIARELHDELAQGITAVRALAGAIVQRSDALPGIHAPAQGIVAVTGELQDGVRNILYRLRPLAGEALADRLQGLIAGWQAQHPAIAVEQQIQLGSNALPDVVAQAVLRIVQEGLTNVARHAQATRVRLTLEVASRSLQLCLANDGLRAGDRGSRGCGLGLAGVRERVAALGGQVSAAPAAEGFVLAVRLPLLLPCDQSLECLT